MNQRDEQRDATRAEERLQETLTDLRRSCGMATEVLSRGSQAYDADITLQLAAEAVVARLGECVNRLPEGFIGRYPEVPWAKIRGMRNIVAHEYHRVMPAVVRNALESGLGDLRRCLDREPQEAAPVARSSDMQPSVGFGPASGGPE